MDGLLTKADILKKLETVYWRALQDESWGVALRAAELQGKAVGLFDRQLLPKVASIAEMTEEQLTEFIDRLEKRDPTLKDRAREPAGEEHCPEKEHDKATNPESPKVQEEMPGKGYGHPAEPASFAATAHYGLPKREEPANNLYFQGRSPAENPVFPQPLPEWEKPPPIVWPVF